MVHGNCVSEGCYAMTDKGIEEIYALVDAALRAGQRFFRVHIFPFRMTDDNMNRHRDSQWIDFWKNLKDGYDYFENNGFVPPNVEVRNGLYTFERDLNSSVIEAPSDGEQRAVTPAGRQAPGMSVENIASRVSTPDGFHRISVAEGSFGSWLRKLPVRPGRSIVYLHDGRTKSNQNAHHAVLDVDVGTKDLQQCADAVMRLRAEYLFAGPCSDDISFNFTSGDTARWTDWRSGMRPTVDHNRVSWLLTADFEDSYENFRRYLDVVFTYVGSASLSQELLAVHDPGRPEIGDVYIEGGHPGHAVLIADVAENDSGDRIFLLAQSYVPAQDIHVLRNYRERISPWYRARSEGPLSTPEWEFDYGDLKRFRSTGCESTSNLVPH